MVIPSTVVVHAVCISSPALRAQASVLGTIPTLEFDIARFINQYQVRARLLWICIIIPHPPPFLSRVLGMRLYMQWYTVVSLGHNFHTSISNIKLLILHLEAPDLQYS